MRANYLGILVVLLMYSFQVSAAELNSSLIKSTEQQIGKIFPGRVSEFTVSPDGRRVAYLAWAEGRPTQVTEDEENGDVVIVLDGKKSDRKYSWGAPQNQTRFSFGDSLSKFGFSPDGKKFGYISKFNDLEVSISSLKDTYTENLNVSKRSECSGINDVRNLKFSSDSSKAAFVASSFDSKGPSCVIVNGQVTYSYPQIEAIYFSPDSQSMAIVAKEPTYPPIPDHFVVVAGQKGKKYSLIFPVFQRSSVQSLVQFSPDSKRYAYSAQTGGMNARDIPAERFVVVNEQEGKHYAGIGDYLEFSPDSRHLLYIAKLAEQKFAVVIDEVQGKTYHAWNIDNLVFSTDSKRVAYVVSQRPDGGEGFVVLDGKEEKHYKGNRLHSPVFSPDSQHFAYIASSGGNAFAVLDGVEGKGYSLAHSLTFSPDSSQLAYIDLPPKNSLPRVT